MISLEQENSSQLSVLAIGIASLLRAYLDLAVASVTNKQTNKQNKTKFKLKFLMILLMNFNDFLISNSDEILIEFLALNLRSLNP